MKGILAKRYGDLILDIWSGFYRSIAPVKLRVRNMIPANIYLFKGQQKKH